MKVAKFGGSSLASATQIKRVFDIVQADKLRKFIVVSAPGKRSGADTKVTDALISYYKAYKTADDKGIQYYQNWIIARFREIYDELELKSSVIDEIADNIHNLAHLDLENVFTYDTFLAAGENNNAKLIADFFTHSGLPSFHV